jgi:hypothetical protein
MSPLPKWVEQIKNMEPRAWKPSDINPIFEALTVALEALESGSRHFQYHGHHTHDGHDMDVFKKALSRIEALGESK